jgi:hypothetical protein
MTTTPSPSGRLECDQNGFPNEEGLASEPSVPGSLSAANGGRSLRAALFNLMLQRFHSSEVAERITDRIIEEAKQGEQRVRDYLRKNLEP